MARTFRKKWRLRENWQDDPDNASYVDPEAPDHSCRPRCGLCGNDVKYGNHKNRLPFRDKRKLLED